MKAVLPSWGLEVDSELVLVHRTWTELRKERAPFEWSNREEAWRSPTLTDTLVSEKDLGAERAYLIGVACDQGILVADHICIREPRYSIVNALLRIHLEPLW